MSDYFFRENGHFSSEIISRAEKSEKGERSLFSTEI
jgi:hypothetical protein